MTPQPYRSPATPPEEEGAKVVLDEASRLGVIRSIHRSPPLWRALLPGTLIAGTMLVGVMSAPHNEPALTAVLVTLAIGAFMLLGWGPWHRRHRRVEVHARGLAVVTPSSRDAIAFEDVDALWYELDFASLGPSSRARIIALRLVDHAGVKHRVPLSVDDPASIVQWAVKHCSDPLLADAQAALRAGETLTFGDVRIDREGIAFGKGAKVAWNAIRLARLQPGVICLFRRLPILPWRKIRLDATPHPTLFIKLFRELAPEVEIDDPLVKPWKKP